MFGSKPCPEGVPVPVPSLPTGKGNPPTGTKAPAAGEKGSRYAQCCMPEVDFEDTDACELYEIAKELTQQPQQSDTATSSTHQQGATGVQIVLQAAASLQTACTHDSASSVAHERDCLLHAEQRLDAALHATYEALSRLQSFPACRELLWLDERDLRAPPALAHCRTLAVKAPLETTAEVPSPAMQPASASTSNSSIRLQSPSDPMAVYLVHEPSAHEAQHHLHASNQQSPEATGVDLPAFSQQTASASQQPAQHSPGTEAGQTASSK